MLYTDDCTEENVTQANIGPWKTLNLRLITLHEHIVHCSSFSLFLIHTICSESEMSNFIFTQLVNLHKAARAQREDIIFCFIL